VGIAAPLRSLPSRVLANAVVVWIPFHSYVNYEHLREQVCRSEARPTGVIWAGSPMILRAYFSSYVEISALTLIVPAGGEETLNILPITFFLG
jgi:hypothetical protein